MNDLKILFVKVTLIAILCGSVSGQVLYVSPAGSDINNNCSLSSSPCTFPYALQLQRTSIIIVESGLYILNSSITINNSEIEIRGNGNVSVIDLWDTTTNALITFNDVRRVIISNVNFATVNHVVVFDFVSIFNHPSFKSNVTFANCTFTTIRPIVGIRANVNSLEIRNSSFYGSYSIGVDFTGTTLDAMLTISDSVFQDITTDTCGAVNAKTGNIYVIRSRFVRCQCSARLQTESNPPCEVSITGSACFASAGGGAIKTVNTSIFVYDSHFERNGAYFGGAIASIDSIEVKINRTLFIFNFATQDGGGVLVVGSRDTARRVDLGPGVHFEGNMALRGSGLYIENRFYAFFNASFSGNTGLDTSNVLSGAFYHFYDYPQFSTNPGTQRIEYTSFNNNYGGAVVACGDFSYSSFLSNANYAEYGAGAISCDTFVMLKVRECDFSNNTGSMVGAILARNVISSFVACDFTNNNGSFGDILNTPAYANSNFTVENCTFKSNINHGLIYSDALVTKVKNSTITTQVYLLNMQLLTNSGDSNSTLMIPPIPTCNSSTAVCTYTPAITTTTTTTTTTTSSSSTTSSTSSTSSTSTTSIFTTTTSSFTSSSSSTNSSSSSPSFFTTGQPNRGNGSNNSSLAIGLSVSLISVAVIVAVIFLVMRKRRRSRNAESGKRSESENGNGNQNESENEVTDDGNNAGSDVPLKTMSTTLSDSPILSSSSPLSRSNPYSEFESCFIKEVHIGKEIGAGAFGTVFEGTWHGAKVAVKSLYNHNLLEFAREALTMKKLSHPNIVQFMGIYKDVEDEKKMYMVTEFVDGGNLETMLRDRPDFFSFDDLLRITMEVVSGMRLLEQKGIIHRDLAVRNILIDTTKQDLVAKVADFGMSRDTLQYYTATSPILFPIKWSSPEVIKFNKYSLKSDIWAMGVTMWEIFSYGEIPYRGMTNREAAEWVCSGNRLILPPHLPPPLCNIITSCWSESPHSRPSFKAIYDELEYIRNPKKREMEAERDANANLPRDVNNYILDNPQGGNESDDDEVVVVVPSSDTLPTSPTLESVPSPLLSPTMPLIQINNNNNIIINNNSPNFDHLDFNHMNALNNLNPLRTFNNINNPNNNFNPHSLTTTNKLDIITNFTNTATNFNNNKREYEQVARQQRMIFDESDDSDDSGESDVRDESDEDGNINDDAQIDNNTTTNANNNNNNNNNISNISNISNIEESIYQDGFALMANDTPN